MKIRAFLNRFDSLINDNLNNNPQLIGSSISDVNRLSPNWSKRLIEKTQMVGGKHLERSLINLNERLQTSLRDEQMTDDRILAAQLKVSELETSWKPAEPVSLTGGTGSGVAAAMVTRWTDVIKTEWKERGGKSES